MNDIAMAVKIATETLEFAKRMSAITGETIDPVKVLRNFNGTGSAVQSVKPCDDELPDDEDAKAAERFEKALEFCRRQPVGFSGTQREIYAKAGVPFRSQGKLLAYHFKRNPEEGFQLSPYTRNKACLWIKVGALPKK